MHSILLIDDSPDCFNHVEFALGKSNQVKWASSVENAWKILENEAFELILLDIGLPDGDGFHFCSLLKEKEGLKEIPVIFLSGNTSVSDKVLGFSLGAYDYISKPFDTLELRARVEANLKKRIYIDQEFLHWNGIKIHLPSQSVWVSDSDLKMKVELTPHEFKILVLLIKNPSKIFSRDDILDSVWGDSIHVFPRSVDTHVSNLRKKLGVKGRFIRSIHGIGYKIEKEELQ